tara:strand:- start:1686 stop:2138 length:453 start_codon:yes stop_codon:yes gene_type:complete
VSIFGSLELLLRHHTWKNRSLSVDWLSSHLGHHKGILTSEHHVGVLKHLLLAILVVLLIERLLLHHWVEHHILHAIHHEGVLSIGVESRLGRTILLVSSLLLLGERELLLHLSQVVLLNDERYLGVSNFAQLIEFLSVTTVSQHFAICYH